MPHPEPVYVPASALERKGTVPISGETQIAVRVVATPGQSAEMALHVCLERRLVSGTEVTGFAPTSAGFKVPVHLAGLLAAEIERVAKRAAEHAVWAPPADPGAT